MEQSCFKCGEVKSLSDFYKHPMMANGHVGKCKECNKSDVRENRVKKIDYYTKYEKGRAMLPHRIKARNKYIKTESGKEAMKRAYLKHKNKFPQRYKANYLLTNAVRDNRLIKGPCEVCGTTERIHGHHDDYSKPLDVRWLCVTHHRQHHANI